MERFFRFLPSNPSQQFGYWPAILPFFPLGLFFFLFILGYKVYICLKTKSKNKDHVMEDIRRLECSKLGRKQAFLSILN